MTSRQTHTTDTISAQKWKKGSSSVLVRTIRASDHLGHCSSSDDEKKSATGTNRRTRPASLQYNKVNGAELDK